jgi:hypothetical protein
VIDTAAHQLIEVESLLGGGRHLVACSDELVGSHYARIKPVNHAATLDTADHADVRPVDLGNDFADEVFRKSKSIRHFRQSSHSAHKTIPAWLLLGAFARRKSVVHEKFCTQSGIGDKAEFAQRWHFLDSQNRNSRWVHDGTSGQLFVPVGELA